MEFCRELSDLHVPKTLPGVSSLLWHPVSPASPSRPLPSTLLPVPGRVEQRQRRHPSTFGEGLVLGFDGSNPSPSL